MNKLGTKLSFMLLLLFLSAATAFSQVTTSGMTGKITTESGEPLPGAAVVAIHLPSGTQYGTITNGEGRFNLQGMRSGGPYKVEVSFVGFNTKTFTDITLLLGEPFLVDTQLKESTVDVGEVLVVGSRPSAFTNDKAGAITNISNTQIVTLPSISRSITDFTRLSPLAGGSNSFAGRDGRYNNIQIDGANLNNNFGLSNDPLPGGGSQPISLDAIEEVSVNVTPFDVRQANFTGAGINAITKSGDNTFKGSVYGFYRNQNFNGRKVGDQELPAFQKSSNKSYGFRLGGPIVKNKLFFFVNAEQEERIYPGITYRPSQPGLTGTNVSSTPIDSLKKLSDYLKTTYNYDPGAYDNFPNFSTKNTKFLVRLDWNISPKHKFTVKYSDYNGTNDVQVNGSSVPGGGVSPVTRLGNNRFSSKSMAFANSNYGFKDIVKSGTAELNSKLTSGLSNQLLATYTKIQSTRTFNGGVFPTIDFLNVPRGAAVNNQNYMHAGMDPFTYNNDVINNIYSLTDNLTYIIGKHTVTGGISYEHQRVGNMFMPASNSYYIFRSLNDFMTNQAPYYYAYTYSLVEGKKSVYSAELKIGQLGIYLQDEFNVSNKLKLTYGVRVDKPLYDEQPIENPAVAQLTFQDKNGQPTKFHTGTYPKSVWYWSPRIGFRWDVTGDKNLIIRGGTGLYTGRIPFVFLTNIPTNSAMYQVTAAVTSSSALANYKFSKDPDAYASTFPKTAGTTIVNNSNFVFTNPDFKFPQVWRSSLGVDKNLGGGFSATVEAVYTKDINAVYMYNANLKNPDGTVGGVDNRPRYLGSNKINSNIGTAIVLDNTKKGDAISLTGQISKSFSRGLYGSLAYTYTNARSITGNPGSQATSVWNSNPTLKTGNTPELARSQYTTPNRIVGTISYKFSYLKNYSTTVSLFYLGYDDVYSYTYSSDMNGDGNGYDLVYIPKDPSEIIFVDIKSGSTVQFTAQEQVNAFFKYVNQDKYLSKHKGQYATRNGVRMPFYHSIDAKILQDFNFNIGKKKNTIELNLDIVNLPNLISKYWGIKQSSIQRNLLVPAGYNAAGVPTFQLNTANKELITKSYQDLLSTSSTWGIQLGLRYIF